MRFFLIEHYIKWAILDGNARHIGGERRKEGGGREGNSIGGSWIISIVDWGKKLRKIVKIILINK